jgi:putative membrane protein
MFNLDFAPVFSFIVYFMTGLAYVLVFSFIYIKVTPYSELQLIRVGNVAASISFSGALIGYAFPLSKAIEQSDSAIDLFVWATIGLSVQLLTFRFLHIFMPELSRKIPENAISHGVILAAISIVVGLLNAACMTI